MTVSFEKERLTAIGPEGVSMGYIRFPGIRPGLVNITSVTVLPGFRGQGVEEAMMEALLCRLEETGRKAVLTAPIAQRYIADRPHWKHIPPDGLHLTTH